MADSTYYGTTDSGTDLYTAPGGGFQDENGVPLSIASGTDINLSSGDSLTYGGGPTPPMPSGYSVPASGNANNALVGIADIFGAVGTAFSKVTSALNPARPTTLPGTVGAYVYNPQTGQYVPAVQGAKPVDTGNIMMVLGVGALVLGLVYVLKK